MYMQTNVKKYWYVWTQIFLHLKNLESVLPAHLVVFDVYGKYMCF